MPAVVNLAIHTEGQHHFAFREGPPQEVPAVAKNTTLLRFSKLNGRDPEAIQLLYMEIPRDVVHEDRFYLKLLHVRSPQSFEDLKMYEATNYKLFKETALAMGLLEGDGK